MVVATTMGHEACVSALLEAGADSGATNEHGAQPLFIAARNLDTACLAVLLQQASEHNVAIALHVARESADTAGELAELQATVQSHCRWRRRRALALVREQRLAARDEAMARKVRKHVECRR